MSARDMLKGIEGASPLSDLFFSPRNVKIIQRAVVGKVFKLTTFLIDEQDSQDVMIVMRSVYLQNALTHSKDIQGQICDLDRITIDTILSDIIPAIKMQDYYVKQLYAPRQMMDRPKYESEIGKKKLLPSRF